MGRSYRLLKKINQEQADAILKEVSELPMVKGTGFNKDLTLLNMEVEEDCYPDVMSRVVNIFRRLAGGCDLSFDHFIYE
ncbi:hypothetical protein [Brotaphodocola sp.]|uniref:hypothetical protein n=1 Tax=Brotaphodocola sp. TaxID=3073577 RepID=UPI003D7DAED0